METVSKIISSRPPSLLTADRNHAGETISAHVLCYPNSKKVRKAYALKTLLLLTFTSGTEIL